MPPKNSAAIAKVERGSRKMDRAGKESLLFPKTRSPQTNPTSFGHRAQRKRHLASVSELLVGYAVICHKQPTNHVCMYFEKKRADTHIGCGGGLGRIRALFSRQLASGVNGQVCFFSIGNNHKNCFKCPCIVLPESAEVRVSPPQDGAPTILLSGILLCLLGNLLLLRRLRRCV